MKKLKIGDTLHRIIDGFEVSESSREVKYSNVKIDFTGKSIADLPLKYQECQLVEVDDNNNILEIIYTGYVNNYTLPKMKNKLEYRELEIDLLSPLALATLRTADAIGTYNLQPLIREIIQPLIDDGFVLKEFNVGNNQITVNYLTETVESALNKLSNKFNFWWYIDKNKNIYINSINYIFNKNVVGVYDDNNKINGLIDFTPSMESIDYCNTLDFTNVRVITSSIWEIMYDSYYGTGYNYIPDYYNPIMKKEYINKGDEIEFDIPFIIDTDRFGTSYTSQLNYNCYFQLWDMTVESGGFEPYYSLLVDLSPNVALANNVEIADSYNEDKEFVFVRDGFFKNLIVGMKYNGNDTIQVGKVYSSTALMWSKVRINDNNEIEANKNVISQTGIVEKQINLNEQWHTFDELLEISNSLIRKNDVNVEKVELVTDEENNYKIGDIISIDKSSFLTYGEFVITDKKRSHYDNVDTWTFTLRNTSILESYIDLFRASEDEEQSDKVFNLITGDYSNDGIREKYEVEV